MDTSELNRTAYNKIAEDWIKDHQDDTWWQEGTDAFITFLPAGGRVLDVGCAGGWKSRYLIDHGFQVVGFDISERFIEIAQQAVPEAEFHVATFHTVNRIPGGFDGVFVQAVLLHVPKIEIKKVLGSLAEKLKPGGYFYLAVKERRDGQPEEQEVTEDDYGYRYTRFFSYYTQPELEQYLAEIGFVKVFELTTEVGKTRWLQLVAKKGAGRG